MLEPWNNDPAGLAYQMFMVSGNPGYYMLYSDLMEDEEKRQRERERE